MLINICSHNGSYQLKNLSTRNITRQNPCFCFGIVVDIHTFLSGKYITYIVDALIPLSITAVVSK